MQNVLRVQCTTYIILVSATELQSLNLPNLYLHTYSQHKIKCYYYLLLLKLAHIEKYIIQSHQVSTSTFQIELCELK